MNELIKACEGAGVLFLVAAIVLAVSMTRKRRVRVLKVRRVLEG